MIRKLLTLFLVMIFPLGVLAQGKITRHGLRLDRSQKPQPLTGEEKPGDLVRTFKRHSGRTTAARGPGQFIMESYYDYGSNGGVLDNLLYFPDENVLVFARMAAPNDPGTSDRGSWWALNDGRGWIRPIKVEAERRGWTDISAYTQNEAVISVHLGGEVNIEHSFGVGVFNSHSTGQPASGTWPRNAVTASGNIIVVTTRNGESVNGVISPKNVAVSTDRGATWTTTDLLPDPMPAVPPAFGADDQAIDTFGENVAIAVAEFVGNIHLWQSTDGGMNWTYRNLTNYSSTIPPGQEEIRTYDTCDLIYDNDGNLHIFWEAVLARQDTSGSFLEFFYNRNIGIQHWSEATGITQVVSWADLPDAALESDATLFSAGVPFDQVNADGILTMQPQAGVDAAGHLYLLFAALRPLDFDVDSTHFTDLYAVGSGDGGASWGAPVNVTDTQQSEDLWASLFDVVDDSLRFVYHSDGNTGNSIIGGGEAPTTFLYHAFPASEIPFERVPSVLVSISDTLTGSPGNVVEVPLNLSLDGNRLASLGAALRVTNPNLSFMGFTPGPIVPGVQFNVNAVRPDSVRIAYVDFGGGPISQEGLLVTLQFQISSEARAGEIAGLNFSDLSASLPDFSRVPLQARNGKITIVIAPATLAIPDTLVGAPGDTIAVPVMLARAENEVATLGAAIKATNGILQFVKFTTGSIIPGPSFRAAAPAPDSVRLGFVDFGGGPIRQDGLLATLFFVIAPEADNGEISRLIFSESSLTNPRFENLPVTSVDGEVRVMTQPGEILGVKFEDLNANGKRENNEPGLPGWQIVLGGERRDTTLTGNDGRYRFTNLEPGSYTVTEVLQTGWQQSLPAPSGNWSVTLRSAAIIDSLDFGNWRPGEIQGMKWSDYDSNGVREANEPGLKDWKIWLRGVSANGSITTDTTATDDAGNYSFNNLAPGNYTVGEVQMHGWVQTHPPTGSYASVLNSSATITSLNFGNHDTTSTSVTERTDVGLPKAFELAQNYPNPFNPETTIRYALPKRSHVRIEVFGMLGNRVAVLMDKAQPPGYHTVKFISEGLPGGMYFYKLTTEEFVDIKKMLLIK